MTTTNATRTRRGAKALLSFGTAAVLLSACAAGAGVTTSATHSAAASSSSNGVASTATTNGGAANYNASTDPVVQAISEVSPAVVNITSRIQTANPFFGGASSSTGTGTGFIVRSDGIVVTNDHVVEGASSIRVTLPAPDGRSFTAKVLSADTQHDLAVLKIDASALPTVSLGNSSNLQLGQRVIALGYALDLRGGPTVTSGIVSSLDRTIQVQDPNAGPSGSRTYKDALQTDAAINPGNSGGPLINLDGQVVGIDSAGTQQAQNIGFAIAINAAKPIIAQAIA